MARKVLEKQHVENPVTVYARKKRIIALKLNVMGQRGWPDRAFFAPGGRLGLVEFKRPGCVPTPLQLKKHADLRALGFEVAVIDNVPDGKAFIDRLLGGKDGARQGREGGTRGTRMQLSAGRHAQARTLGAHQARRVAVRQEHKGGNDRRRTRGAR